MKVLTAAEMREVDRRTIEMGIPGIVLMENAGHRVVEFLAERFAPLEAQRIVVLCGKGNNGGDGLVIARQLHTRFPALRCTWCCWPLPEDLKGDARPNYRHAEGLRLPGLARTFRRSALRRNSGGGRAARHRHRRSGHGRHAERPSAKSTAAFRWPKWWPWIFLPACRAIRANPRAKVARADYTVTFTAPKLGQVLPPNCDRVPAN